MFYVYELVDPRDGRVFYVGKGSGNRDTMTLRSGNLKKRARIKEIRDAGKKVIIAFFAADLTEAEAFRIERERITHYGFDRVTNIQPGSRPAYVALLERVYADINSMIPLCHSWSAEKRYQWLMTRAEFFENAIWLRQLIEENYRADPA